MKIKRVANIFLNSFLFGLLIYLLYDIFFGDYSFSQQRELKEVVNIKEEELSKISNENQNIKTEIQFIKDNDDYLELIAREELGLVREGEEYIDDEPE
jgi:cell division protein FtsB